MSKTKDASVNLERGLKNRHIQLISIGGVIGTGLFLGSGKSIELAGPSLLISYILIGGVVFLIARALGELLLSDTSKRSYIDFVEKYLGKRAAFITGWSYWFCWISLGMADLTATGMYIKYWAPDVPQWLPEIIVLVILAIVNFSAVKYFGEIEFWFALIKVIAVLGLIIVGTILLIANFGKGNDTSISNLWNHGGFFPNGASGFLLSFQKVTFAFVGVEVIGIMAGEAKDPETNLPKAINNVPIRVAIFYVGALFIIMCVRPWTEYTANFSPFVQVFEQAGILIGATIVNFVVLTSAASACNSAIYSTSRMLHSMGENEQGPSRAANLNKNGVPASAVLMSTIVILVAVIVNYFFPSEAFDILSSLSTICFVFVWGVIVWTHKKYRDITKKPKAFPMPFYPYSTYLIFAFIAIVTIIMLFISDTLVAIICLPFWLGGLFVIYNLKYKGTK
ncbi:MAG: amino acid permease [Bifidobacteriaceae bacterium]|jgi:D-serine/D-alanine/glycine transporter|nr:amino acid permease [Bifidobacteriaceae bacterium]